MILKINIPDNLVKPLIDTFAAQYKYQAVAQDANGENIANPVSKAQFARNVIKSFIREVYVAGHVRDIDAQRAAVVKTKTEEIDTVSVSEEEPLK